MPKASVPPPRSPALLLRLLGELTLRAGETVRVLPRSRKTRALLVYLALEDGTHRREALCELLWESTADPRAALRWSLSKLRPLLATADAQALRADARAIGLDRALIDVDVLHARQIAADVIEADDSELAALEAALAAGLPDDLDRAGGTRFQLWLAGQRETLRRVQRRLLDEQDARADRAHRPDAALHTARRRVALDPLDDEANARLLVRQAEVEGRPHARRALDEMRVRYRAEGLSDHALVARWRGLDTAVDTNAPLALPDRPSVAVLGFTDLGGHAAGALLAEGLAADLTATLGHLRGLFVTARASSSRIAAYAPDVAHAGRLLGVRYLVHGTTQRCARRVRVTVTLADAAGDAVVWSEHFDRAIGDLFALQDDICAAVASAVEPAIARAEAERTRHRAPEDLNAWECYHRAMWHCFRFTAADTEQAHHLLQRALVLEAHFARAHAGLSFTHYSRAFLDAVPAPQAEIARALEHAQHSVALDPLDAMGHWTLGRAQFLARDHDQAQRSLGRSLAANPNFAQGHYALGFLHAHAGAPAQALPELAAAERLSPFDPLLFAVEGSRAISLAVEGRYDDAATWSVRATHEPHAHFHIAAIAAACLVLARRLDEARLFARRACHLHPGYSVRVFERSFPQKLARHQTLFSDALRRAGVPDGDR